MQSYPIWINVENCNYKSSKDFGWKNTGKQTYNIGSSSKNSSEFLETCVTKRRRWNEEKEEYYWVFSFSVDGVILKKSYWTDKNERPKDEYKVVTKLNRIKGL